MVIWLVGLSGSGKTTISQGLGKKILSLGKQCLCLDGDILREICGHDLSYEIEDRKISAKRLMNLCKFLDENNINVVCSVVYLIPEIESWYRQNLDNFFEVFLDAPLEIVRKRDVKGLYRKALDGEISNVVGVDLPFEKPSNPDLVLHNDFQDDVIVLIDAIFEQVRDRL